VAEALISLGLVAVFEIMTTPASSYAAEAGIAAPEQLCPTTATTPSAMSFFAAATACSPSQ
jgi:hypothetical protein